MTITEPVTLLTDYILAVETLVLGVLLYQGAKRINEKPIALWAFAFFAVALAAVAGGTCHGFVRHLSESVFSALWKITLYSIGISTLFMFLGMTLAALKGTARKILMAVAILQFCVFAFLMAHTDNFTYVVHDYVPAMAVILALCTLRLNRPYAIWIIAGILVSFAAAGIQLSGFRLHKHFNHNDLYHVVQMLAMYLLYCGGKLLSSKT